MIHRDNYLRLTITARLALFFLILCFSTAHAQNFREVDDFGWARGEDFTAPFLVDLDDNGRLDLIVGTEIGGLMRWEQHPGDPDRFVRVQRDYQNLMDNKRFTPVYHDIDGDGKLDLLLMTQSGNIDHYIQDAPNSTGFTLHKQKFSNIKVFAAGRLWLGDLDGNGLLDIITGSSDNTLQRYEQASPLSFEFQKLRNVHIQSTTYYLAPALHDIDGDGLLEMFLGGMDSKMRLLRQHAAVKDSFLLVTETWSGIDDHENATPVIIDVDNDGLLDLFAGSKGGLVRHYEQASPNTVDGWQLRSNNVLGQWDFGLRTHSLVCDLDNDGRLDILRTEVPQEKEGSNRAVQHFRQTAVGALTVEHVGELAGITAGLWDKLGITDLEKDGLLDLFVSRHRDVMEHYRQRSGQPFVFDLVTNNALPAATWTFPPNPTFVDLDGNGKLDLLLFNQGQKVMRLEQETAGSAGFVMRDDEWMVAWYPYPSAHILDYDTDGVLDMILGTNTGKLLHFVQTAPDALTFEQGTLDFPAVNVKLHAQPSVVDVNNDGRLDFIVGDGAGGLSLYIDQGPVSVPSSIPAEYDFRITQLSPNPCADAAALVLDVSKPLQVTAVLYDLLGREVLRLADGRGLQPGYHRMEFSLEQFPAGMYSVVVSSNGQRSATMLIKQ